MSVGPRRRSGVAGSRSPYLLIVVFMAVLLVGCGDSGGDTTTTVPVRDSSTTSRRQEPSTTTTSESSTSTTSPTTTTPPTSSEEPPAVGTGVVGVIGCSNTDLAVSGYTDVSSLDRLVTGDLGGGTPAQWGDPADSAYSQYWGIYEQRRPAEGYSETWIQLCIREGDHQGAFDDAEMAWITHIVEQVHLRDPGLTIWMSPINSYEGVVCDSIGADGPAIAAEAADWAASTLDNVFRGPDLGPITSAELGQRDNCHPNSAGQRLLGGQLVEFFD